MKDSLKTFLDESIRANSRAVLSERKLPDQSRDVKIRREAVASKAADFVGELETAQASAVSKLKSSSYTG